MMKYATDEAKWEALETRDALASGHFIIGVLSTGIYCRPGCPARTPLRKNVRFFADGASATAAGLRPCKRCKPEGIGPAAETAHKIAAACRAIELGLRDGGVPGLSALAAQAGLSESQFQRHFKSHLCISPKQYEIAVRDSAFKQALLKTGSITEALYEAGYRSASRLYETATARMGMNAKTYKKGAPMQEIRYQIAQSWLGPTLIAATEKGICAVFMDTDKPAMIADLHQRFPKAIIEEAETESDFAKWVTLVLDGLDKPAALHQIPFDIQGTAFQEQVWRALQDIPGGETWTYKALAQHVGNVKAVRAVAAACGANPISVLIPCHRVIGSNGKLTGYRWGVERKRKLLAKEGLGTLL